MGGTVQGTSTGLVNGVLEQCFSAIRTKAVGELRFGVQVSINRRERLTFDGSPAAQEQPAAAHAVLRATLSCSKWNPFVSSLQTQQISKRQFQVASILVLEIEKGQ